MQLIDRTILDREESKSYVNHTHDFLSGALGAAAWVVSNTANVRIRRYAARLQGANYPVWMCDGTADNVQIQAALNALPAGAGSGGGGGTVLLSDGNFPIAASVELMAYQNLIGMGPYNTKLTLAADVPLLINKTGEGLGGQTVANLKLDGASQAYSKTSHAFRIQKSNGGQGASVLCVKDMWIQGFKGAALYLDGVQDSRFEDIFIDECGSEIGGTTLGSIHITGNGSAPNYNSVSNFWRGITIHLDSTVGIAGIYADSYGQQNDWFGTKIEHRGFYGIILNAADYFNFFGGQSLGESGGIFLLVKDGTDFPRFFGWKAQGVAAGSSKGIWVNTTDVTQLQWDGGQLSTFVDGVYLVGDRNTIRDTSIYNNTRDVFIEAGADDNFFDRCRINGGTVTDSSGTTTNKFRNCGNYVTKNSGTATVASGQTTVTVTHGLTTTPTRVQVTPTLLGNAASFWVTAKGTTTFVINVNADPGAGTATFDWEAQVGES